MRIVLDAKLNRVRGFAVDFLTGSFSPFGSSFSALVKNDLFLIFLWRRFQEDVFVS